MKKQFLFKLGSKLYSTTFQASAIELDKIPDPTGKLLNDHDRLIYGDYAGINFPVILRHVHGKKMCDILDTGWPCFHLISERFKQVLEENHLIGWKTFPIKLLNKKNNEILGYHGLSITGRSGPIDYSSSQIIQKNFFEGGPFWKYYKGFQIDTNNWDGSDFFLPQDSMIIIVTNRVSDILRKVKITNISLNKISEIELSEDIVLSAIEKAKDASSNSNDYPL